MNKYRVMEYAGTFLAEKRKDSEVWDVLAECDSRKEAEEVIKEDEESE